MRCAKCDAHVPDGYTTCPVCGIKREFTPGPTDKPYIKILILSIAALALLGLFAVVFAMVSRGTGTVLSATGATPSTGESVVAAPPPAPPSDQSVLSAPPADPPSADTSVPYNGKPKPSQAIIDYLNFVKKVEEHRRELLKDTSQAYAVAAVGKSMQGLSGLLNMMDDESPTQANQTVALTSQELTRQKDNWAETLKFFDGCTAPEECAAFAQTYRNVLVTETSAISSILDMFGATSISDQKDVTTVVARLQEMMKGGTQAGIDEAVDQAKAGLDQLVSSYDMARPFEIERENGGNNSVIGF